MINVLVTRGRQGDILALKVYSHGESIVCAAVSALVLNAVNSIEALTDEAFTCGYVEEGGFLEIRFLNAEAGVLGHDARLLVSSLMLGLESVSAEYPDSITIDDNHFQ